MPKVIIYEGEPYDYYIDQGEMFDYMLEEDGIEISDELLARVTFAIKEKREVNKILGKLKEEQYEKQWKQYDDERTSLEKKCKVLNLEIIPDARNRLHQPAPQL